MPGYRRIALALTVSLAIAAPVFAATPQDRTPAPATTPPPPIAYPQALVLIRTQLIALQQANATNDYNVLLRLGSQSFQAANTQEKLAQIFANLRKWNLNAVAVLDPTLTEVPRLTAQGMLEIRGYFTIESHQLNFMLLYQPEGGRWRLFGLGAEMT